jgi:phosphopantetheinyl transferase (holo-ACP synthase)
MHRGQYELHGIFKDASQYNLYYGSGCLATEHKSFPSMLKGTTVAKYMAMDASAKEAFRKALDTANLENKADSCVNVFLYGTQYLDEDTNFSKEELNAPLEGVDKDWVNYLKADK